MFRARIKQAIISVLVNSVLTGAVFLLSAENALADADLTTTTSSFISADPARSNTFMDSAGVWNGTTEVTNTTGDTFRLTVTNSASGNNATEIQNNTAYAVSLVTDVSVGFRLPVSPFTLAVTELSGGAGCLPVTATATQPGGTGTLINTTLLSAGNPADIPPGCSYQLDTGLTTSTVAPFVINGSYNTLFIVSYSNFDNTPANPTESEIVPVEVRIGEVAISKVNSSPGPVADGDPASFTVSVISAGQGGLFNVAVTDTLSSDFDLASLNMVSASAGTFVNPTFTIPYIAPNVTPVVINVTANVQVDANATSCPVLTNTVNVIDRTGKTDASLAVVPFDLQEPLLTLLTFSAPDIDIPLNGGPVTVSVTLTNSGTGTAKNISLRVAGSGTDLDNFGITVVSPNWTFTSATDVFSYNGTIATGASETLSFTLFTATCPPPPGGLLSWSLGYDNVCGTGFNPAAQTSNLTVSGVPAVTMSKVASVGILNVGDPASYTLGISGTDLSVISDGDDTNNNDFSVADTFPLGIQNIDIPLIPAGTEVEVQGVGIFTGAVPPGTIPENGTIFWRGDTDVLGAGSSMLVNFDGGGAGVCPTGSIINNSANITAGCGINEIDTTGFILNDNPFTGTIAVTGGPFEAGAPDTNNINRDENREGEFIPFTITYTFPAGYEGGSVNWDNLTYNAELRSGEATGSPLVLSNNRDRVLLTVTTPSGATSCTQTPLTKDVDFTGGEGVNPLNINFAFLPQLCGIGVVPGTPVDDITVRLEYVATSPEGVLAGGNPYVDDPVNDANIGTYLETTTLTVVGGTPGCSGNNVFTQAVSVSIDRADLDLTGDINNGNAIEVCSVVPVNINLNELVADTTADNLLFNLGLSNLQIVDGANAASANVDADITRNGGFSAFSLTSPPVDNLGPVDYQLLPITADLSGPGSLSFNARVLDISTTFNATVSFDSKHTSPDNGGAGGSDADQDYSFSLSDAPVTFLSASLDLELLPPAIILRDQTSYSFRAHIVNTGDGEAAGGLFEITLPPEMNYVSSTTTPAGATAVVTGQTVTWTFADTSAGDLKPGEFIDIDIVVSITQASCFNSGIPAQDEMVSVTDWGCGLSNRLTLPNTPGIILPPAQLTLNHDLNDSFCELCSEGEIHLFVTNTGGLSLTNVDVIEDLLVSGLEMVPGSMNCIADEGACNVAVEPVQAGTTITITPTNIPLLSNLYSAFSPTVGTPQQIEIIFRVQRPIGTRESIVTDDLSVAADAQFGLFCDQLSATPVRISAAQNRVTIPLRQPAPTIQKQARNVTANQDVWRDTVYGGTADQVIWRVDIQNLGNADLQDLKFDDVINMIPPDTNINFDFHSLCLNETDADNSAVAGNTQGSCQAMTNPQQILPPLDDITFPPPSVPPVDIPQNEGRFIYLVGVILNRCENMRNNAQIDWGCDIEAPVGGVVGLTGGFLPPPAIPLDTADLSTKVNPVGLLITQAISGVNPTTGNRVPGSPVGSKGMVRLVITNNTGGTIRDLQFTDTLPANYSYDSTRSIQAAFNFTPAFNDYLGNVDTITEDVSSTPTIPVFNLTTTGAGNIATNPIHNNVLRHGDVLTIDYGIVRSSGFDTEAHPEVREETAGLPTDPLAPVDGFDVIYINPENNQISFEFDDTCDVNPPLAGVPVTANQFLPVAPEDLDVDINSTDPELFYVLGNP
ncbi:hypothetical protein MNBD_GAMMA09-1677, partial [hydrothermal vent metagenome]